MADGRRLILLAEGRVVNLVAAEGNPAAVMDLSFAVQALALAWLGYGPAELLPGVHEVPDQIDTRVASARARLARGRDRHADTSPGGVPGLLAAGVLGPISHKPREIPVPGPGDQVGCWPWAAPRRTLKVWRHSRCAGSTRPTGLHCSIGVEHGFALVDGDRDDLVVEVPLGNGVECSLL